MAKKNDPNGPSDGFLADMFTHLPILVARLTTDGMVLDVNPQVCRVTGYALDELCGRNFWAVLFPGRLFAQIPRFLSLTHPQSIFRDYPLTLRTHAGHERIVAWTRLVRTQRVGAAICREVICFGQDLTDRLTDAERSFAEHVKNGKMPAPGHNGEAKAAAKADAGQKTEEPPEGTYVKPLAISPPASRTPTGAQGGITDAQERMAQVEVRMEAVAKMLGDVQPLALHALAGTITHHASAAGFAYTCLLSDHHSQASHMGMLDAAALQLRAINELNQTPRK